MPTVATRLFVAICWLLAALQAKHDPAERTSQPSPAATTTPSDDPAYDALLARLAERPGDVAKAIAFLCDETQSGKVSGSVLEIFSNE